MTQPKAIFIGPAAIGDVIERVKPQWDFLPSMPSIPAFNAALADGKISNDISIIITADGFFDPKGENNTLEQFIADMSNYCFFCLIAYKPEWEADIRSRADQIAYQQGQTSRIYFIDKSRPSQGLNDALARFLNDPDVNTEVKNSVRGTKAVPRIGGNETEQQFQALPKSQYKGQVITVTSSKGGSGKSTVAMCLATFIARASENAVKEGLTDRALKVALVDLDVRDGQIGFLTGQASPTVVNLLNKDINETTVAETAIYNSRLKVDLFLAPKKARAADDIPPEFYVELIQQLKQMYDFVILDTSVNYLDPLLEKVAYPAADKIIFITDIVINSIFSMSRWVREVTRSRELGGMGINPKKIGIVVNKSLRDVSMTPEEIDKATNHLPMLAIIPSQPKMIAHSANIQSMDLVIQHEELFPPFNRLARLVVGKDVPLSKNVK